MNSTIQGVRSRVRSVRNINVALQTVKRPGPIRRPRLAVCSDTRCCHQPRIGQIRIEDLATGDSRSPMATRPAVDVLRGLA